MQIPRNHSLLKRVILCLGLCTLSAKGAQLEKTVSIDIGVGVPQLVAAGVQVLIRPWLQAGVGYGMWPGSIAFTPEFETPTVTLANGVKYDLSPANTLSLSMLSPYLRLFPAENNFYFQLTYNMLRAVNTVRTNLVPQDSDEATLTNGFIFNITTIQPVPCVSIGHIFTGKLIFFNISLGASFFLNPTTSVSVTTSLPDEVGGAILNSAAATEAEENIKTGISDASKELQKKISVIPSMFLSIGFVL